MTEDGPDDRDVWRKTGRGRAITSKSNSILWSKNINRYTKLRIFKSLVESTATYGSEIWTLNKQQKSRINAMENNYLRRCCNLTLLDRVKTDEIRARMNVEKTLTDKIEEKQLSWYGHMRRMPDDRLPIKCFKWIPTRRRKKGRPRTKWKDGIMEAMARRDLDEDDWRNKKEWHYECGKRPAQV